MNPSPLARAARRAASTSPAHAGPSKTSSSYPPKKSNGRTLPASTLRSLISLHHSSAGFLHTPQDLPVGFENAFKHTSKAVYLRGYYDFAQSVQFNQSLHPPGGMENLVEKPKSSEARGLDLKGRTILPAETVQRTFKRHEKLWSEKGDSARGVGRDEQYLSDRELRVQEALYGTWERGGSGMDRVEPGLEGVLDYVEAKGKTVSEYAKEWENRDEEVVGRKARSAEETY
ncbi:hypothetical protein CI109_100623 [Kwoniella shandongensis]|uniref:Uncharacterized protein n=1 Tax=Kwoniella shandongensis TaxID=1734106 RepID=A0A5M6BZ82_9TREE|nr:uncharacterized protein CI109_003455 [Kwoniella shandongensis]KAA5528167.1 hypothetical protein CI109_003455 [Kwoniella shandongensis]